MVSHSSLGRAKRRHSVQVWARGESYVADVALEAGVPQHSLLLLAITCEPTAVAFGLPARKYA